jgi:hypothetical protein
MTPKEVIKRITIFLKTQSTYSAILNGQSAGEDFVGLVLRSTLVIGLKGEVVIATGLRFEEWNVVFYSYLRLALNL